MSTFRWSPRVAALALSAVAIVVSIGVPAASAEPLRVGKAAAFLFAFVPLDIGIQQGFFRDDGLEIQDISFNGAAKADQALVADSVDVTLGSGATMAVIAKGVPARGIAMLVAPPLTVDLIVPFDSPVKTVDDLKGKLFGIATVSSVTDWMARELGRVKGWGPDGVRVVALGSETAGQIAAIVTHQVDAIMASPGLGFQLEEQKRGRILIPVSDYVSDYITHVAFATDKIQQSDPDGLRRFLKGWFESVAYMRGHKAATVAIAEKVTGFDRVVEEKEYDLIMPGFSDTGRFPAKGLAKLARSYVELGILDREPDMRQLYTENFLPAN